MKLVHINSTNIQLLQRFIDKKKSGHFRYYDNRGISCIQNHIYTVILQNNDNEIMGYAHIDFESGIHWIAICILDEFQKNGHGTYLLQEICKYTQQHHVQSLNLSVDVDNSKAVYLYLKHGFIITDITSKYYVMKKTMGTIIEVPVSIGECIDKLSILEIKKQFIKNEDKLNEVSKEFTCLQEKIKYYMTGFDYYYNLLIHINKKIWNMQDLFRDSKNKEQKQTLCLDIIDYNDRRFRIKNKINFATKSTLKEVKGYNQKKCFVLGHLGMGDHLTTVGLVRYLSTIYDEIIVVCIEKNKKNVMELYSDDETIQIYSVENVKDISPRYGCPIDKFQRITIGYDLFLLGSHNLNKSKFDVKKIPFCFYEQMNVPGTYMWEYFNVPCTEESNSLYKLLRGVKYIFIHNMSSEGEIFSLNYVSNQLKNNHDFQNIDEYIIINPNINLYNDPHHPHYTIAEKCKGHSILSYKRLIENTDYIFVSDSSFFCLAFQLQLKGDHNYLIQRASTNYTNYEHIWSEQYKFDHFKRKRFIKLNSIS